METVENSEKYEGYCQTFLLAVCFDALLGAPISAVIFYVFTVPIFAVTPLVTPTWRSGTLA